MLLGFRFYFNVVSLQKYSYEVLSKYLDGWFFTVVLL